MWSVFPFVTSHNKRRLHSINYSPGVLFPQICAVIYLQMLRSFASDSLILKLFGSFLKLMPHKPQKLKKKIYLIIKTDWRRLFFPCLLVPVQLCLMSCNYLFLCFKVYYVECFSFNVASIKLLLINNRFAVKLVGFS